MTPAFEISVGGKRITSIVADRLLSLRVTDEAGIKADGVQITLDDRDGKIITPPTGAAISLALGYQETGLIPMGIYTAAEVILSSPPQQMSITGKSANMSGKLKEQKSRTWEDKTLKDIVTTIAAEHEITPRIADKFANFTYESLAQTNESDLHFLGRLSKEHDALFSIKGNSLLFGTRGRGLSLGGQRLPSGTIYKESLTTWRAVLKDANDFTAVTAKWREGSNGELQTFKAGEGSPVKALRNLFSSEAEAKAAATGKLSEIKRAGHKLSLIMPAQPQLAAESPITLKGFKGEVDGTWSITSITHELKGSGFTSRLEAERPEI